MTPRCAVCPHLAPEHEGLKHYCWGTLSLHHPNERVDDCKFREQQYGFVANTTLTFHRRYGLTDPRRTEKLSDKLARRIGFKLVQSIAHWCPACSAMHDLSVVLPFAGGSRWIWDRQLERPTFQPENVIDQIGAGGEHMRCRYSIERGFIHYHDDCTHGWSGRLVPLPDIPKDVWDQAGIET